MSKKNIIILYSILIVFLAGVLVVLAINTNKENPASNTNLDILKQNLNQQNQNLNTNINNNEAELIENINDDISIPAGMKNYTDPYYGFSFNYPEGLTINTSSGSRPDKTPFYYVSINLGNDALLTVSPISYYILFQDGIFKSTETNMNIDGYQAVKTVFTPDTDKPGWGEYLPEPKASIKFDQTPPNWNSRSNIALIYTDSPLIEEDQIFNQILDSFRFTD